MYSHAIDRALEVAITAHHGQTRKGDGDRPYATHPIHMAVMLARYGMDETVILAAVLHDVVEDCDDWDVGRVEEEFGKRIARIVDELSEDKSRTWRERKETAIDHIARMSSEAVTVKAVDQLHNLESLRHSLETTSDPDEVWGCFRGGRQGTLEVARRKVEALERRVDPRLARSLRSVLERIAELAGARSPDG